MSERGEVIEPVQMSTRRPVLTLRLLHSKGNPRGGVIGRRPRYMASEAQRRSTRQKGHEPRSPCAVASCFKLQSYPLPAVSQHRIAAPIGARAALGSRLQTPAPGSAIYAKRPASRAPRGSAADWERDRANEHSVIARDAAFNW